MTVGGTPSSSISFSKDMTEACFPALAQASTALVKVMTLGTDPCERISDRSSRAWKGDAARGAGGESNSALTKQTSNSLLEGFGNLKREHLKRGRRRGEVGGYKIYWNKEEWLPLMRGRSRAWGASEHERGQGEGGKWLKKR